MLKEIIVAVGLLLMGLYQLTRGKESRSIGWLFLIASGLVFLIGYYGRV